LEWWATLLTRRSGHTPTICFTTKASRAIGLLGFFTGSTVILLAVVVLFGHSSMDRIFGYGLKFEDEFKNTHLGRIG